MGEQFKGSGRVGRLKIPKETEGSSEGDVGKGGQVGQRCLGRKRGRELRKKRTEETAGRGPYI